MHPFAVRQPGVKPEALAPRVSVVDDDRAVLDAVSRLLSSVGYEVRTFSSGERFFAEQDHDAAECVLLDLYMPGMTGLEVQEALVRARSPASVIFITAHGDVPSSVRAMKGGAVDYLVKPFDSSLLVAAVEAALARSRTLHAARSETDGTAELFSRLTPREREVLGELLEGMRNKQIAAALGAAEKTIKVHRARVLQKMGVRSIAELASRIERAGLRPHVLRSRS
jgi:FixJ family two-component response regulator